jgi:hypothetical protein
MPTKVFDAFTRLDASDVNAYLANKSISNAIINGAFDVWQRGTAITQTSNQYTADMWRVSAETAQPTLRTITRQTFTPNELKANGFGDASFYLRSTLTTIGSSTAITLNNRSEDVSTLAGQNATFSFWAKSDTSRTQTVDMRQNFGSGGSSQVTFGSNTFTTTTSWQRFVFTMTFPDISGKTIGTGSWIGPNFTQAFAAGSVLDLWGVQLEPGTVANDFRRNANSIQGELAACQRYFFRIKGLATNSRLAAGYQESTTASAVNISLPVSLRVPPVAVSYAALWWTDGVTANATISSLGLQFTNDTQYISLSAVNSAMGAASRPGNISAINSTAFIDISAEL